MLPSKRLVSILCCLGVALAVLAIAAPDANGQCSRRGGCPGVASVPAGVPANAILLSVDGQCVADSCAKGTCVAPVTPRPQGCCEASVLNGPVLVEGRPFVNIGRRLWYRLRHPFAPIARRGG